MASMYHFLGWNSYFTQCWYPFPLTWITWIQVYMERRDDCKLYTFILVNTRQFPTKCAEYPTPLLVLKLSKEYQTPIGGGSTHQ